MIDLFSVGLLLLTVASARADDTYPVRFVFTPDRPAQTVAVAGSFNAWNVSANPMQPDATRRTWACVIALPPGEHQYKFVVDGGRWFTDPHAARSIDDGNGNINSVVLVTPRGYDQPARIGDGHITGSAVYHGDTQRYITRPDPDHLVLTLRTRRGDVEKTVLLQPDRQPIPMESVFDDLLFTYWRVTVRTSRSGIVRYAFMLRDGPRSRLYDRRRWLLDGSFAPEWLALNLARLSVFETPSWARDAVFYQIFPDRFANGDPSNDPKDVQPWDAKPTFYNRFGGDLQGVRDHLAYLDALGINSLYFNPVFAARSNHRYDTTDYHRIDPELGTNQDMAALVAACHNRGWHVILDGVFNHTGVDFAGFQDLRRQGQRSPYRHWYYVKGYPIVVKNDPNYLGWWGSPWMPKLNVLNPETRDYLLDVGTRWIRISGIDGWRLDAANEVDRRFWRSFRSAVRSAKPDAYLVGEIWGDGSSWLQGDQFDSVMNYRWRGAVLDGLVSRKIGPAELENRLAGIRMDYPPQVQAVLFNMLSSHDTERLLTVCRGDVQREELAVLFQMTYPGTPCVYYGDEVGMEGSRDPDNRRGMVWDTSRQNAGLLAFYRQAISLRRHCAALRRGGFKTLAADDRRQIYAFARQIGAQEARVILNVGAADQTVAVPTGLRLALSTRSLERRDKRTLTLPPDTGALFIGYVGTARVIPSRRIRQAQRPMPIPPRLPRGPAE